MNKLRLIANLQMHINELKKDYYDLTESLATDIAKSFEKDFSIPLKTKYINFYDTEVLLVGGEDAELRLTYVSKGWKLLLYLNPIMYVVNKSKGTQIQNWFDKAVKEYLEM